MIVRIALSLSLIMVGCMKKAVDPEVSKLMSQYETAVGRMGQLEAELNAAGEDPATLTSIGEEKELLKSRIERLREILTRKGALAPQAEGTERAPAGH